MPKKLISALLIFLLFFQIPISVVSANDNLALSTSATELNELSKKIVKEIVDKREEKAKYFELDNNQIMKVDYSVAIHKLDENGNWQDAFNKKCKNFVKFNMGGLTISRDDYEISVSHEDALYGELVDVNSEHKIYKNIYENTDLEYKLSENKLEENLILNSVHSPKEFVFNYSLNGLTANQISAKTIKLLNENQKCVYTISAPKMFDATNAVSEDLSLEILKSQENKLKVKMICDKNWIESSDRVFPVVVDPDYKDEFFDFTADKNGAVVSTNWRKKDTSTSVFLNLTGSDFKDFGVITVSVFGRNRNGELNCTYKTNCYFLEAGRKYELYNSVHENGCDEVQIRFKAWNGQHICGKWSPDYLPESGVLRIGGSGGPGNVKDTEFSLIVSPSRSCWTMIRTKANASSVYLQLFDPLGCRGGSVDCSIWGMGGKQRDENCTYQQSSYTLQFGKKYELLNMVKENNHSGVQLKFEGTPGTVIRGKWSPDYIEEAGCERVPDSAASGATAIRPIMNPQKLIDVPQMSQKGEFPTGCESVSAVMVLHFYDCGISVREFIDKYLVKKSIADHPDPNSAFVGSPYDPHSYGCFAPCIAKAMNKVLRGAHAEVIRGKNLKTLSEEYTKNGVPVLIWATIGMRKTKPTTTWTIGYTDENARYKKGDKFTWPGNEHCVVLIGFNEKDYFVNDPWQALENVRGAYAKNLLEERFREQGSQAVVIRKIPDYTSLIQNKIDEEHDHFFKFRAEVNKIPLLPQKLDPILKALLYFFQQVTHNGPWDIKVTERWNEKFPVRAPETHEKFKFHSYELTKEDLGNLIYGYLGSALGLHSLTLYIGGGAANHGKNPIEMALAVISQIELYTPPDYGDDHNDHINVERGIELYRTLHPSIPKNSLYFAWDRGGLYVFSETLMVALRRKLGKDDEETNKRLVSDFTNYLRMLGIVK